MTTDDFAGSLKRMRLPLSLIATAALSLVVPGTNPVSAQGLERYQPDVYAPAAAPVVLPDLAASAASDDPFGVTLSGIVVLGPRDAVATTALQQVDISRTPRLARSDLGTRLGGLIGTPLSSALVARIEVEIIEAYRDAGYPFVAVSTPPQEISTGLLNLRVVEFSAGAVVVRGGERMPPERVRAQIRQPSGAAIDADALEQDLAWLNRSPFRRVQAEFSPGGALGETDLTLDVRESRPWSLSAGYANSGSAATGGRDRLSFGASASDLLVPGSVLAYRLTASPDALSGGRKSYIGHSLLGSLPVGARQEVSFSVGLIDTRETAGAFDIRSRTQEVALGYRAALSNFSALPGDIRIGVEQRSLRREIFFGPPPPVISDRAVVRQLMLGWNTSWSGRRWRSELDLSARLSPGNLGGGNKDADFAALTAGRMVRARYGYLSAVFSHERRLSDQGNSVSVQAISQLASGPLPGTEQFTLGGVQAVRGYTSEDGAFDTGLILRGEYRFARIEADRFRISPSVFADVGVGREIGTSVDARLASFGFAAAMGMGTNGSAGFVVAHTLRDGTATPRGRTRLHLNLTFTY